MFPETKPVLLEPIIQRQGGTAVMARSGLEGLMDPG